MNRTSWVAKVSSGIRWAGAMALVGGGVVACTPGPAGPDTGAGVEDAPILGDTNRRDTNEIIPLECSSTGAVGAHCRSGRCASTATCVDVPVATIQSSFMLRQAGAADPAHAGYYVARTTSVPAEDAPFNAATGSLCAQRCDPAVADTCGGCTTCSQDLTQAPIVAEFGGVVTIVGASAGGPGICRLDCAWNATAPSPDCPTDMACDPFSGVCIEACTTDVECNTGIAASYSGEVLTILETAHPRHCNSVTGRCEATGSTTAQVGTHCVTGDDCRAGTGVCLAGGRCAEFGCPTPNTVTSTCGGPSRSLGICLTASVTAHPTSICLMGCNSSLDCGAGNICNVVHDSTGHVVTIGTFTGYCIGGCASDDQCIAAEACTDTTNGDGSTNPGRCAPRCTGVGLIGAASGGCADTEFCAIDHTGASYGHCSSVDQFCGAGGTHGLPAASSECPTGFVCDELLADVPGVVDNFGDGHCTHPCAGAGDCGTGTTCVTSGIFTGLCRHACTTATECAAMQMCTMGWCVD